MSSVQFGAWPGTLAVACDIITQELFCSQQKDLHSGMDTLARKLPHIHAELFTQGDWQTEKENQIAESVIPGC